ncbi:MAG: hypothetical protein U5R46_07160 [Gammaproteobacteria bacterium]|nr:hypothetical protein [Gammaproteobacteria bacterium]
MREQDENKRTDALAESRRQSFRKILGAGGLVAGSHLASGVWVKPVVNAVVLPAHGATSPSEVDSPSAANSLEDPCFVVVLCTDSFGEIEVRVDGEVVPPTPDVDVLIEIAFNDSESFQTFASTDTDSNGRYQGTETYSSTFPASVQIQVTLPEYPDAGIAECSVSVDGNNDSGIAYSNRYYSTGSDDPYFCATPVATDE